MKSLDEHTQEFITALDTNRSSQWEAGDAAARAIMSVKTKAERRHVVGHLAAHGHCTRNYIAQLADVATAFEPGLRHKTTSWSCFRAVLAAARRTNQAPADVLKLATDNQWHAKELNALGRTSSALLTCDAECPTCGSRVSVRVQAGGWVSAGLTVACPVCPDTDDAAPTLGVLA